VNIKDWKNFNENSNTHHKKMYDMLNDLGIETEKENFKLLYKSDSPKDLIILGGSVEDKSPLFEVTDDESEFIIKVGDQTYKCSCDGFGNIISPERYEKWTKECEELYGDDWDDWGVYDRYLLKNFQGDIRIAVKLKDGSLTDDFNMGGYIQHQDFTHLGEDKYAYVDVVIILPKGTEISKINKD